MAVATSTRVAIRNVAVATDFSPCSERAVEHGVAVARHFGAKLHFLHLLRPSSFPMASELMPALAEAADHDYDRMIARLNRDHRLEGIECRRWVRQGEVPDLAGSFVEVNHIDLLILGTHGRTGLPRLLLGSVAQQIFHYVRCPVLTVGPRAPGAGPQLQLRRVLFATDLSPESLAAVPWVLTAVEEWRPELDVAHVCKSGNPAHREAVDRLTADLTAETAWNAQSGAGRIAAQGHWLTGKPAAAILDCAASLHADLIVLGLKPHRALYNGTVWSHAYEIVRQAPCPVLSIRAGVR